ncbi:MAG TPA: GlsB/YeaQ/YmgE family stress response membrane protein [Acetobacteraceae bacterium]|nr:GlsB/YeaQ/YmgE family stress response membrane protein [Acetobacteraceae bacterium]
MSIAAWIVLGLIAGFIAGKVVSERGDGLILNISLGVIGALVGGFIFSTSAAAPIMAFNPYGVLVAVIGAIIVLVLYHALFGRGLGRRV